MVVGKVSEFIGSLYYLCVTLLRFKNIMKLKNYLLLLAQYTCRVCQHWIFDLTDAFRSIVPCFVYEV